MGDGAPVPVVNAADLMSRLATSFDAQRTYAERLVSFGYERILDPLDACTVERLTYKISQREYSIPELVLDLTQTEAFRLRVPAADTAP